MGKIVNVVLNNNAGVVNIVGGREKVEKTDYDKREYRYGVSLFFNGKYLKSFVVLEHEVELLMSDMSIKMVDDLNWIFFASEHKLALIINRNSSKQSPQYQLEEYGIVDCNEVWSQEWKADYIRFTSNEKRGFLDGLKYALENPVEESNIFHRLPQGYEIEYF